MKNMKKLLLLVLSLALMAGVFAFATLAEEAEPEVLTATVVYPDGSREAVAVGATITPKEFKTEGDAVLYYGADNTLFKDDATEGWIFTVEGADAPLADLTVTEEMAGKKIIASGVDKVYYTSAEKVSGVTTMVYHLIDNVNTFYSTSNTGDRGDGTNTGALPYTELRKTTTDSVTVKLYEDGEYSSFSMYWFMASPNRIAGRPCYLDLNGHSVVNNTTSNYIEVKGVNMKVYSSVAGAHWYQPKSASMFYASDDGTIYLG